MPVLVLAGGLSLIGLQVLYSYANEWLTVVQMQRHHAQGVPYLYHFGALWGDLVLTILLAHIVNRYGSRWSVKQVVAAFTLAVALSAVMHWQYAHDTLPGAHGHDGRLTMAGWLH